ncbi:hypothetical protein PM082_014710 [Marasmius tenuissimus]|nr:hypothetical protein PM082_014710 [Marasmius tenuissimus]
MANSAQDTTILRLQNSNHTLDACNNTLADCWTLPFSHELYDRGPGWRWTFFPLTHLNPGRSSTLPDMRLYSVVPPPTAPLMLQNPAFQFTTSTVRDVYALVGCYSLTPLGMSYWESIGM